MCIYYALRYHWRCIACASMKRVPLLLPQELVDWIDSKTKGIENRNTFIRRLILEAKAADHSRSLTSWPAPSNSTPKS